MGGCIEKFIAYAWCMYDVYGYTCTFTASLLPVGWMASVLKG